MILLPLFRIIREGTIYCHLDLIFPSVVYISLFFSATNHVQVHLYIFNILLLSKLIRCIIIAGKLGRELGQGSLAYFGWGERIAKNCLNIH